MGTKIKYTFIFYFLVNLCSAQNWVEIGIDYNPTCVSSYFSLYGDSVTNQLFIGGNFVYAAGTDYSGVVAWNGNNFNSLLGSNGTLYDPNIGDLSAFVKCITRYKEGIYVGGSFNYAGSEKANNIAFWDGNKWNTLASGLISSVNCLLVKDDCLYVGGAGLDSIIGYAEECNGVVMWDGANWHALPPIPEPDNLVIVSILAEYKGELYAGGNFGNWNDTIQEITKWNGTQWVSVGGGIHGDSWVEAMAVYKGYLYVGGYFYEQNGNAGNFIMRWDGEEWSDVGGGLIGENSYNNGQVHGMFVFNDELWVGGVFTKAGGIPSKYIAKWDGEKWCSMEDGFTNRVRFFGVLNNELYVGGGFHWIDTANIYYIAKWTGGNYVDTCSMPTNITEVIQTKETIIYPNPANTTLNISHSNTIVQTIQIFNQTGQLIKQPPEDSNSIDISGLPVGTYIIRMVGKDNVWTEKFVVIK